MSSFQIRIARLCSILGLPIGDENTQDWAFEVPDKYRKPSDIYRYLEAFTSDLNEFEQKMLASLILDATNDVMATDASEGKNLWVALVPAMTEFFSKNPDAIAYWACVDSTLEDAFAIAPYARRYIAELEHMA